MMKLKNHHGGNDRIGIELYKIVNEDNKDYTLLNLETGKFTFVNKSEFSRFNIYFDDKVLLYQGTWFKVCKGVESGIPDENNLVHTCEASTKDYLDFDDCFKQYLEKVKELNLDFDKELWDCIISLMSDLRINYIQTAEGIDRETFNKFRKYFKNSIEQVRESKEYD